MSREDQALFDSLLSLDEDGRSGGIIPAELIKRGIASNDLETNGLTFAMLHSPGIYRRVVPPLTLEDFQALHIKYLPRCMKERSDSEWTDSPHLAGYGVARWFLHLWSARQKHLELLTEWKVALGKLFVEGDKEVRHCVVCGVLEHIFGNPGVREFFCDWQQHPVLQAAYDEAVYIVAHDDGSLYVGDESDLKPSEGTINVRMPESPHLSGRAVPLLTLEDFQALPAEYLRRCMKGRGNAVPTEILYLPAYSVAVLFLYLWRGVYRERSKVLAECKAALGELFVNGGSEVRKGVVRGVLAHLFGNARIRKFFSDWEVHALLRAAYDEAVDIVAHDDGSLYAGDESDLKPSEGKRR